MNANQVLVSGFPGYKSAQKPTESDAEVEKRGKFRGSFCVNSPCMD